MPGVFILETLKRDNPANNVILSVGVPASLHMGRTDSSRSAARVSAVGARKVAAASSASHAHDIVYSHQRALRHFDLVDPLLCFKVARKS